MPNDSSHRLAVIVSILGLTLAATTVVVAPTVWSSIAVLFIFLSIAAGLVSVPLPAGGSLSLVYPFVLATMMEFGLGASVTAGCLATLVSWRGTPAPPSLPRGFRVVFHVALVGLCATIAGSVYLSLGGRIGSVEAVRGIAPIAGYTVAYAVLHLGITLVVAGWAERVNTRWIVLGFMTGSALATMLAMLVQHRQLVFLSLAAPFLYVGHLAHRARVKQVEEKSRHSQQTTSLYRSVTEALVMAIEAKDDSTEGHLRRVQRLCLAIGERMRLSEPETEALGVASLLHDIGKIAVPEYILTKPGRLTPDEAERMKAHPGVGADILGRVPFPYPLAPIVRHHHERWDGNGYPDGLCGEAIPLGARILSVVDCYDALISERPYRSALSREETLDHLKREAGKMFDPDVVEILVRDIEEIEAAIRDEPLEIPGAGTSSEEPKTTSRFDTTDIAGSARVQVFQEILRAQREMRTLYDISRTVGRRLGLEESLMLQSAKLAQLVPYRSLVVYLFDDDRQRLVARFAVGQGAEHLLDLAIPVGQRLTGWAAKHQRAFIGQDHRNPLERDGARSDLEELADRDGISDLRSTLVAPLTTDATRVGVLALYNVSERPYDAEHRRVLEVVATHVAQAVQNSLPSAETEPQSLTDPLTGVPNGRFFFLESEFRLSRARESGGSTGVVGIRVDDLEELGASHGQTAANRSLGLLARRIASACGPGETVLRFGGNVFLVLTDQGSPQVLSHRSHEFAAVLRSSPVEVRLGTWWEAPVRVAHASFPGDGQDPEQLLDVLEHRLETSHATGGKILPFPVAR